MKVHKQTIAQVAQAFKNLGSSNEQARIMAEQLVKRADQLAKENTSSFIEELGKLLETVSCGAQGRLKPSDETEMSQKSSKTAEK
jgi:thioesterase domain-containing protein